MPIHGLAQQVLNYGVNCAKDAQQRIAGDHKGFKLQPIDESLIERCVLRYSIETPGISGICKRVFIVLEDFFLRTFCMKTIWDQTVEHLTNPAALRHIACGDNITERALIKEVTKAQTVFLERLIATQETGAAAIDQGDFEARVVELAQAVENVGALVNGVCDNSSLATLAFVRINYIPALQRLDAALRKLPGVTTNYYRSMVEPQIKPLEMAIAEDFVTKDKTTHDKLKAILARFTDSAPLSSK